MNKLKKIFTDSTWIKNAEINRNVTCIIKAVTSRLVESFISLSGFLKRQITANVDRLSMAVSIAVASAQTLFS